MASLTLINAIAVIKISNVSSKYLRISRIYAIEVVERPVSTSIEVNLDIIVTSTKGNFQSIANIIAQLTKDTILIISSLDIISEDFTRGEDIVPRQESILIGKIIP